MKYNIIFLLMNIFLLISCSAKDRNSDFFKVRDSVNLERQKSLEAAKKLDELLPSLFGVVGVVGFEGVLLHPPPPDPEL